MRLLVPLLDAESLERLNDVRHVDLHEVDRLAAESCGRAPLHAVTMLCALPRHGVGAILVMTVPPSAHVASRLSVSPPKLQSLETGTPTADIAAGMRLVGLAP